MPFTLVGFSESQAADGLTKVAAVADEHVTVSGDDITVPELSQILGALFSSGNIAGGQLQSPSLRRLIQPDFIPLMNATTFTPVPPAFHDFSQNPIELERSEKINALIDNGNNSERGFALLWLIDGIPVPSRGAIRTLKCTAAGGSAAYAWTNQALTLTQTLPAGRYSVVGMHAYGATATALLATRLVFVGGAWRPGVIGGASLTDNRPKLFRYGNIGSFGEFEFDQPPTIDYFATGATGALQILLDIIQIRSGR